MIAITAFCVVRGISWQSVRWGHWRLDECTRIVFLVPLLLCLSLSDKLGKGCSSSILVLISLLSVPRAVRPNTITNNMTQTPTDTGAPRGAIIIHLCWSAPPKWREARDFWCPPSPPVWTLRAVSLIPLFYICSLFLLPSPVALYVLPFSGFGPFSWSLFP